MRATERRYRNLEFTSESIETHANLPTLKYVILWLEDGYGNADFQSGMKNRSW